MADTKDNDGPSFGDFLRQQRAAAGMTQVELAERAGLSARGISDLERGARSVPRPDTLELLLAALRLPPPGQEALRRAARRPPRRRTPPVDARNRPPLPAARTPLIGRERETAVVIDTLRQDGVRLVTLTGPGGVGKTRLAVQVADVASPYFPDGVAFVELAPLSDPALVMGSIARTLGVPDVGARPLAERVGIVLRGRDRLLVLDNFEHLTDAAPLVADLLAACPLLKVLVTSRVVLRLSGEHDFAVHPLALPAAGQPVTVETATASDAVRLFVARAHAVSADFGLTEANISAVVEVCRRLDGLPLALELAAARVTVLPPAALLVRLERRLPLLVGGTRDAPARQQTLRGTIAWSHDLLNLDEQRLFRRLAVFAGGFTLDAAEAVGGVDGADGSDVLGLVSSLVDRSLIHRLDAAEDNPRFGMLETVREFAFDHLVAAGEELPVRRAQATHLQEVVAEFRLRIEGPHRATAMDEIEREVANVRAVLAWAVQYREAEIAHGLAGYLGPFWMDRGFLREALDWLEPTLLLPGASPPARVEALYWAGFLALWQGDRTRVARHAEEAISLSRVARYDLGVVMSHNLLAEVAKAEEDQDLALVNYEEAFRLVRGLSSPPWASAFHGLLLGSLGEAAERRGDLTDAVARYEEALTLWRRVDHPWGVPMALAHLADIARLQGDILGALALQQESLARRWQQRDRFHVAWNLWGIADLLLSSGHSMEAARLLGAASALFTAIGFVRPSDEQTRFERVTDTARTVLGDVPFTTAWVAGEALPTAEAVREALDVTLASEQLAQPDPVSDHGLSIREREVLRLIAAGRSNHQIAETLFISPRTVSTHATHILDKLGLASRAEVIAFAFHEGLV